MEGDAKIVVGISSVTGEGVRGAGTEVDTIPI